MEREQWEGVIRLYQDQEDARMRDLAGAVAVSELVHIATIIEDHCGIGDRDV